MKTTLLRGSILLLATTSVLSFNATTQAAAPVAKNVTLNLDAGVPGVLFGPASLATDADGDALTFTFDTPPSGSVIPAGPNLFVYQADPATFGGQVSFQFTVEDPGGLSSIGTITIKDVTPPQFEYVPSGKVLVADSTGFATLPNLLNQSLILDNIAVTVQSQDPAPGASLGLGFHTITLTVEDAAGNENTQDVLVQVVEKTSVVAVQGDYLDPETQDTRVLRFGVPSINANGEVAYLARLATVGQRSVNAILAGKPAARRIATRDEAPGVAGATFAFLRDPVLDKDGNVAFIARVAGESITKLNDYGIWFHDGSAAQLVAREGAEAVGVPGGVFQRFVNISIEDSRVFFVATLVQGGSITKDNDQGLWSWTPQDGLRLLARETDPVLVPGTDGGSPELKTLKIFTVLRASSGSLGHGRNRLVNSSLGATSLLWGKCSDGTKVLAFPDTTSQNRTLQALARSGGRLEGLPGIVPRTFGLPANNNDGEAVVSAVLSGNGNEVNRTNSAGVFLSVGEDGWVSVARRGDSIAEGVQWRSFKDPILNDSGDVAWIGSLAGTGVSPLTNSAIWHSRRPVDDNNNPLPSTEVGSLIAREGDAVPEVPGAKWAQFVSVALPDGNPANGPIFVAKIASDANSQSPAEITPANDLGVWALDGNNELRLLLREGESIEINEATKTVKKITVLGTVAGSAGMTRSFNGSGQVIARVQFTDGTFAIITLQASAQQSVN